MFLMNSLMILYKTTLVKYVYIYIYIYMCVCVCVRARAHVYMCLYKNE